jgi:hypothetical protein
MPVALLCREHDSEEKMLFDLFNVRDWLYYYEVVVTRQGRDQVLARVPSRSAAERMLAMVPASLELSHQHMQWRRARGLLPDKAAQLCTLPLLVALALPGFWLPAVVGVLCLAVIGGLCTSGRHWRQGGEDDR